MLTVIDLFSGVGGLALGFKNEGGFDTLMANDVDVYMCRAFKRNFSTIDVICNSIASIDFKDYIGARKIKNIDLIIGGPPCQAYSTSGKRLMEDPRAMLYQQYFRALNETNPKAFIFENVKGILSMADGKLFEEITKLFGTLGYKISWKLLNAAEYGVPQERERVFIVGSRDGVDFKFPNKTHSLELENTRNLFSDELIPSLTVADAISDLPFITSGQSAENYASEPQNEYQKLMRINAPKLLMDHNSPRHGESLMKIIENVPEGGIKKDIPIEFRPKSGFPNSYGRLIWNKPSTTMTRNLGTPSSARCIHPKCDRALTTREGARIQSFPDDFYFDGSRAKKNLQIGNAVPPLLAKVIAKQIKLIFS
jgi:DNA (cytosine-5)-methyltransferase 1